MSKWTPEPWGFDSNVLLLFGRGERYARKAPPGYSVNQWNDVATLALKFNDKTREYFSEEAKANAQRIVACVNACTGIRDPAAFMEGVRELIAWLEAPRAVSPFDSLMERAQVGDLLAKISAAQEPSDEA